MTKPIPLESKPIRNKQALGFNPQTQPWVPVEETKIPNVYDLTDVQRLQRRFSSAVVWRPEGDTVRWGFKPSESAVLTPAAVLMPLVKRTSGLAMLLTVRAAHLKNHAGQISFPGGRVEEDDSSTLVTALRETYEEVGISESLVDCIGQLPSLVTATGFTIHPYVGLVSQNYALNIDPEEVADAFEVPFEFLMNPKNHRRHTVELAGNERRFYYSMTWGDYFIWGATAELIRNLYHFLCAES